MEKGSRESFLSLLKDANMAYVAVDEPELGWTVGREFPVTATWGAVARFHGRNREGWTKKDATTAEKFRYYYSDGELREWEPSVLQAAEKREEPSHVQQLLPGLRGEECPADEVPSGGVLRTRRRGPGRACI